MRKAMSLCCSVSVLRPLRPLLPWLVAVQVFERFTDEFGEEAS